MAIRELSIRNFAIIRHTQLIFADGFITMTGDTGAGKSIILEAIDLLLGARADQSIIRHEQSHSEITAIFDINNCETAQHWLEEKGLVDADNQQCFIRRVIHQDKPSRCFINDQTVTLSGLKSLGLLLVDLHHQHEHQSLLRSETQRNIVDTVANNSTDLQQLAKIAQQLRKEQHDFDTLAQQAQQTRQRLEWLQFQLEELDDLLPKENEYTQLLAEHKRLDNVQQLLFGLQSTLDALYDNDSITVCDLLAKQAQSLTQLAEYDAALQPSVDLLHSALTQVEEARSDIQTSLRQTEQNPEQLQLLQRRIDDYIHLSRKHQCRENELPQAHDQLQKEYDDIKNTAKPEQHLASIQKLQQRHQNLSQKISTARHNAAAILSEKISGQMHSLGLAHGRIKINVETQENTYTDTGIDNISFWVNTNPGVPFQPLHKTASGGELSRISLAIQVITSSSTNIPTLIFDEIDVGIGGNVASMVGEKLRLLAKDTQVICITHQPQVASQANQHVLIDKIHQQGETASILSLLSEEQRVQEIARMLGNEQVSALTLAKEMLEK